MNIAILGTGQFALAIAHLLDINDSKYTIVGRDVDQLNDLKVNKTNSKYSNYVFKNSLKTELISQSNFFKYDLIFYCLPSKNINYLTNIFDKNNQVPIVFTSKGFKNKFIFEHFTNYVILSGGSYSVEILKNIPCYITLASTNMKLIKKVHLILESKQCLISINQHPKSIELLGIFKNIIAIFCGIITQLNLGKNIESAFISKILNNMNQIIDFDKTTLVEPAGIGDLFLSCSSIKSRNYSFGINLVKNHSDIKSNKLVEGYDSLTNMKLSKNIKILNDLYSIIENIKLNKIDYTKELIINIIHKY